MWVAEPGIVCSVRHREGSILRLGLASGSHFFCWLKAQSQIIFSSLDRIPAAKYRMFKSVGLSRRAVEEIGRRRVPARVRGCPIEHAFRKLAAQIRPAKSIGLSTLKEATQNHARPKDTMSWHSEAKSGSSRPVYPRRGEYTAQDLSTNGRTRFLTAKSHLNVHTTVRSMGESHVWTCQGGASLESSHLPKPPNDQRFDRLSRLVRPARNITSAGDSK